MVEEEGVIGMMWKVWKMSLSGLFWTLVIMLGTWFFGIGMVAVLILILKQDSYIIIGSFMALLVWLMFFVFADSLILEKQFSLAIGMGRTRKEFFILRYIVQVINTLIGMCVLIGIYKIEVVLGKVCYRNLICEFDPIAAWISIESILIMLFLLPTISFFIGMLLIKFQRKAYWAIWFICGIGGSFSGIITENLIKYPNSLPARIVRGIGNILQEIGEIGQVGVLCIVGLGLLSITYLVLKKQESTQF